MDSAAASIRHQSKDLNLMQPATDVLYITVAFLRFRLVKSTEHTFGMQEEHPPVAVGDLCLNLALFFLCLLTTFFLWAV